MVRCRYKTAGGDCIAGCSMKTEDPKCETGEDVTHCIRYVKQRDTEYAAAMAGTAYNYFKNQWECIHHGEEVKK